MDAFRQEIVSAAHSCKPAAGMEGPAAGMEEPAAGIMGPADVAAFGHGPSRPMLWDTITPVFARQAAATPARTAIRCGDRILTYAELDAASNRLARQLLAEGVGRDGRVALLLPRSIEAVVSILAVLKVGAAYVPVDVTYPDARIQFVIADSRSDLIITTSAHLGRLPVGVRALALNDQACDVAGRPDGALPEMAKPDSAIYVIYTSGSTGQPKGASVTQRSFANLLQWYIRTLALGPDDATLLVSALGFDLTQKNIFAPLLTGGTLHLPECDVFDPEAIVKTIESRAITFLNCTPSTFLPLVEGAAAGRQERLAGLRWAVLGGEPIPVRRLLPWLQYPSCQGRILNSYGPTECTDICAAWAIDGDNWQEPAPLGRPIDNVFLAVLDAARQPVGVGVEGELWIGGAGVGLGYLDRPDLNAERFLSIAVPGYHGRMYRTGDRVSWRPDGVLDFFGRLDHQIKIRGHRVEAGEVEAALCGHPAVREACVDVRSTGDAEPRLLAWLVLREATVMPPAAELRAYLAGKLPAHMVPSALASVPTMPLSPNGKIDRKSLPDIGFLPDVEMLPDIAFPTSTDAAPLAAPHNVESMIQQIWRETLGHAPASLSQNFFDAGGTSLGLARVQALIKARLGKDLPAVALFAHPTIAALTRLLMAEPDGRKVTPTAGPNGGPKGGFRQAEALRRMAAARAGAR